MSVYEVASWVVLLLGLIPSAWFGWSWGRRIRNLFTWAAFDAGGWVYALLLVYAYQAVVYLSFGVPDPSHWQLGVARISLGLLLDAVITARAVAWLRLRAEYRRRNPQVGASPRAGDRY